jgi:thiol-disulfide isomerase/thioredoxin
MKGSTVITRVGVMFVTAIALAGCQKGEDPQAKDKEQPAATSPSQTPQAQPQTRTSKPAGPRRVQEVTAYPLEGLTWIKGGPVGITPGNVYVVEFWATWCGPCRVSIPHLTGLQKKYKDKGVTFVGISDEPPDVTTPFVKQMGDSMDYNVASDTKGDVYKGYMDAFRQNGIPTAFVVSAAGKVVWFGHPMDSRFEQVIDQALAAKAGTPAQN